jgi:hypothetical protein
MSMEDILGMAGPAPATTVDPTQLYQASKGLLNQDYQRAQRGNQYALQGAGLATSPAGYGGGSAFQRTNQQYGDALSRLALGANVQANQMTQENYQNAFNRILGAYSSVTGAKARTSQINQQGSQFQSYLNQQGQAANQALWGGIGGAVLGAGGTILGAGLSPGGFLS